MVEAAEVENRPHGCPVYSDELNEYLEKLSDRNLVKFYLEELHDISLGRPVKEYFYDAYQRRRFVGLGVLKMAGPGHGRRHQHLVVDWARVWDILG
jgi:hypothetical protein